MVKPSRIESSAMLTQIISHRFKFAKVILICTYSALLDTPDVFKQRFSPSMPALARIDLCSHEFKLCFLLFSASARAIHEFVNVILKKKHIDKASFPQPFHRS